jgi:hypothetical protein
MQCAHAGGGRQSGRFVTTRSAIVNLSIEGVDMAQTKMLLNADFCSIVSAIHLSRHDA